MGNVSSFDVKKDSSSSLVRENMMCCVLEGNKELLFDLQIEMQSEVPWV